MRAQVRRWQSWRGARNSGRPARADTLVSVVKTAEAGRRPIALMARANVQTWRGAGQQRRTVPRRDRWIRGRGERHVELTAT
jgi:hypothetical protein